MITIAASLSRSLVPRTSNGLLTRSLMCGRGVTIGTIDGRRHLLMKRMLTGHSKPDTSTAAKQGAKNDAIDGVQQSRLSQAWNRFIGPKEMPPRWTPRWYGEVMLICTVFAITGTSTMVLVRPAVSKGLGLEGSLKDGPWSYRISSLVVMTPIYATLLVIVGTVFGRHHYFRHFSVKMWSRFGIPPEMLDASFHETKKTFRKW